MSAAMPAAFTLPRRAPAPIAAEPELDARQVERGVTHLNHAWVDSQADWAASDLMAWDDRRRTVDPFNTPRAEEAAESRAARWFAAGAFALMAATLVLLFALPAKAAEPEVWLNAGGVSWHSKPGRNGSNPGIGAELRTSEDWSFGAGAYRNSDNGHSRYVLAQFTPLHAGPLHAGLVAGAVDGYAVNNGKPMALIAPALELRVSHFAAQLTYMPAVSALKNADTLSLVFKVRF